MGCNYLDIFAYSYSVWIFERDRNKDLKTYGLLDLTSLHFI